MPPRAQKALKANNAANGSSGPSANGHSASGTPTPAAQHGHLAPNTAEIKPLTSPGGSYTIENVVAGCKVFVEKPDASTGELEQRKAEILSVREKPKPRISRKAEAAKTAEEKAAQNKAEERLEYYVHYSEFNKRLDEWIPGTRIILSREIEWPKAILPETPSTGAGIKRKAVQSNGSGSSTPMSPSTPAVMDRARAAGGGNNLLKKAAAQASLSRAQAERNGESSTAAQKKKAGEGDDGGEDESMDASMDVDGEGDTTEDGAVVAMEMFGDEEGDTQDDVATAENGGLTTSLNPQQPPETFSKEQEIEKLRTSGSMTQSVHEIARVKNLNKIQMGKHEVETWYFSPYPIEYAHLDTLYLCEMCLSYFPSSFVLRRHRSKCTLTHPPGNEIYRHEDISFFEIDGRRQKTYCRNLCLLSKCFLDHKTLYYDVDPFLFYIMCLRDDVGCHIIGYFSKEKESTENYNLACILTLPQHQRAGYGMLLIQFSYELSKRENKLGSPEKPLSDLGLLGYRAYWAETIVALLLSTDEDISIEEIATRTAIVHADVLHTCMALSMLKQYQGKHYLVLGEGVIQQHERQMKKRRRNIVPEALSWKPPVFTRDQLRFGW